MTPSEREAMSDAELERYWNIAVRDDWHRNLVGSDIRVLIREIQRLRIPSPAVSNGVREALEKLLDFIDHSELYELENASSYKVYQDARDALGSKP